MQKILVGFLILIMMFCFGGCSKKGNCALCGKQDVSVKKVLIKTISVYACDDCAEDLAELKSRAEWENNMP